MGAELSPGINYRFGFSEGERHSGTENYISKSDVSEFRYNVSNTLNLNLAYKF
jgi:hypothetical protein